MWGPLGRLPPGFEEGCGGGSLRTSSSVRNERDSEGVRERERGGGGVRERGRGGVRGKGKYMSNIPLFKRDNAH